MNFSSKKYVYFAFIWHGFFLAITVAMLDLNTVFPTLITKLTGNKIVFGALYSVMLSVPLVFNVVFSHLLKKKTHKKKYLLLGMYLRGLSFLGMAVVTYYFALTNPSLTVLSFFFFVFLFSISAGFAGISYTDIIAKSVTKKERASLFSIKQFFSSSGAFLGGLIISRIFTFDTVFPTNFATSLFVGFIGLFIASLGFVFLNEKPSVIDEDNTYSLKEYIKAIPKTLKKDESFKYFIIVENITGFSIMILPFYMVFARESFNLGNEYIGIYLLVQTVGTIFSNIVWGIVANKLSSKHVVMICIILGGINPILALILSQTTPVYFGIIFFIIGFMISGRKVGFSPYLLDLTPNVKRVEYLGIRGSLNVLVVVLPLLAGVLITGLGFVPTFILVSVMMVVAFIILRRISDEQACEFC
ncbi:MAG: MFS transporter [Candidatus Izimaplasma sp.]|nr:MFS transporter [Candidatus Izimaplasma bacterium]